MRPIKITITAFGPYKHKEVISFSELKDNKLFVVSGNTGAGKTTIFDAICFALYGSASGEDRSDTKLMRSDFADDDVHTSVELEFELRGKQYRILRQLPHVKKGNKGATGEKYEFFEKVGDQEVPCVDRQIVSEINKRVEELVGLTKDQFSQIVMLPQGEFRKLLTSQTENKEAILRKIFRTEPYKWINERLKDRKSAKDKEHAKLEEKRDRYFEDIETMLPYREDSALFEVLSQDHKNTNQILAGLEEETVFYEKEIVSKQKETEEAASAYNSKLETYHKAEALNEQFTKLEEKEQKLHELTEQAPSFHQKEEQLERAERATMVEVYEAQVNEWREDERGKKLRLADAETLLKRAVMSVEKAQSTFELEEKRKSDREEAGKALDRFHDILPTVKDMDRKKEELVSDFKRVQQLEQSLVQLSVKLKQDKGALDKLRVRIRVCEEAVDEHTVKFHRLAEMRVQVKFVQEYLVAHKKQGELEAEFTKQQQLYEGAQERYAVLEDAWVKGQASILAAHLHDGKPCPVCGSGEHPNKASSSDAVPTKEQYEVAKKELDVVNGVYRDAAAKLHSARENLEEKIKDIQEIGIPPYNAQLEYDQMVSEGKVLNKEVAELEKKKAELPVLRKEMQQVEGAIQQLEGQKEETEKAFGEQRTAFETKKAVYEEQVNRIPEEIRNLAVLEQKIRETKELKLRLEKAWEVAQQELTAAKEEETKQKANVVNAKAQLEESSEKKARSEQQFADALIGAGFSSEELYRQAKVSEMARGQMKQDIEEFKKTFETVKQQIVELKESLKDKVKVDLEALSVELRELQSTSEAAGEMLRQCKQYLGLTKELKVGIVEAEGRVAEVERQLNVIADLYDMVRGQNGSKISFERYLQIEFLEHIIVAANDRLYRLSNGQFHLRRSERQESHGKQSGLGLDVFDAYTGQTRDVKTLSGGEKFNASLCLALGMADVIQSYQGGVSIDTMFIDEGFGSLDEESLNKAIDTLIDLQKSGRMIGVISHVQELKNALPAILEVRKTKEGFSETRFVIK